MHSTLQLIQSLFTFHPGLHCQVKASSCQFPGSATLTSSPSFLQQPSLSRIHVKTCFLQEALHITHAQTPVFCLLVSQKPQDMTARTATCSKQGIPATLQPLTPKDICIHIATPKFLRAQQQRGKLSNHRRPAGARPRPPTTFLSGDRVP